MDNRALEAFESVVGNIDSFLGAILAEVMAAGFDFKDFSQLDHLCYRAASLEEYERLKQTLTGFGKNFGEIEVSGRPISTFLVTEPIRFDGWRIDVLELTSPKTPGELPVGLEHIEFVLYRGLDEFLAKYSAKQFDKRGLTAPFNPRVSYMLPSGRSVKFHLLPLAAVVQLQLLHGQITGQ